MGDKEFIVPALLPPREDGVFKTLLTHPEAGPVLRDVISAALEIPIRAAKVRNAELPISDISEKQERFDVNCLTDSGEQVDVEMQASEMENDTLAGGHRNIKNRAIYNLCDLHSAQQGKGVEYENLLRSFQITFCGYTVFRRKKFVNRFSFRNEDGDVLQDTVGIVFIELSKLSGLLSKAPRDMSPLEMWSVFLAFADKPERCEIVNGVISAKEEIKLASELLLNISQDENERAHFRSRRMLQMDHEHDMIARYNKGQSDMARNLLKAGVSPEIIASSSGLSINEILALRD